MYLTPWAPKGHFFSSTAEIPLVLPLPYSSSPEEDRDVEMFGAGNVKPEYGCLFIVRAVDPYVSAENSVIQIYIQPTFLDYSIPNLILGKGTRQLSI
jgi:hypothetical protein